MDNGRHHDVQEPGSQTAGAPAAYSHRTLILDRRSIKVVERAREAGVPISYQGIAPLFEEWRAYAGPRTDWVIGSVHDPGGAVIPRAERAALLRLVDAGLEFPMIYVAHEVPKGRLAIPASGTEPVSQVVTVDPAAAEAAVGPVPPPAAATVLADRLGHSSRRLLRVLATALPVAGAIAAAPIVLAGAAVTAVGALALDPIVFGVIPAGQPVPGQPAAWYILARWDWQPAPRLTS
jgi:hypothetical protein